MTRGHDPACGACGNLSAPRDAVPAACLRRVLIIAPQLLGDAVLSSVLITALKDLIPDCRIDVMAHQSLIDLFCHNPAIAAVHAIDADWRRKGLLRTAGRRRALIRTLRRRGYDLLIQSPHTTDGSWGPALIALLRIPYAVGASAAMHGSPLKRFFWRRLFTHTLPPPHAHQTPRHAAEIHLDLLRRLGLSPRPQARHAVIEPGAAASARIASLLAARGIPRGGFVLFAPLAGQRSRTLDGALCRDFLDHCEDQGEHVVIISGRDAWQQAFAQSLCQDRGGRVHNLAGAVTLAELAALAQASRLFVGADSGPMHLAAAMGVPVIACFGPGDERRFHPWQVRYRLVTTDHSCRACELDGCGNGGRAECLCDIAPQALLDAFGVFGTRPGPELIRTR